MKTLDVHWSVGLAVHTARRAVKMTQEQLADELADRTGQKWSQSRVSALERGVQVPTVADLVALRDLFGLELGFWVDGPTTGRIQATPHKLRSAA